MGNIHKVRAFIKMIFRQLLFQKLKFLMKTCQVFINDGRIGWLFHSLFLILKNSLFVVNNVPLNELNISHKNKKWNSPFYIYRYILRHVAFFFKEQLFTVILAPKDAGFVTYRVLDRIGQALSGEQMPFFAVKLINTGLAEQFIIHMKTALYVAAVTDYYRKILDGKGADKTSEDNIRQIFSRPWCKFHFRGRDKEIIDRDFVGHRGLVIGKVESTDKGWLRFKTGHAVARYDGIQLDIAGQEKPFGFSAQILRANGRNVFEVRAGETAEIKLPPQTPALQKGQTVYLASSGAVKGEYRYERPKPGAFKQRRTVDIKVDIGASAVTAQGDGIKVSVQGSFTAAENPQKVETAVRTAFEKCGNTDKKPGRIEVSNPDGLFVPGRRDLPCLQRLGDKIGLPLYNIGAEGIGILGGVRGHNVIRRKYDPRPIPDITGGPQALAVVYAVGRDAEDILPLVDGGVGGDHRAAAQRHLPQQDTVGKPRDQPVAGVEIAGRRAAAGLQLGDKRPAGRDDRLLQVVAVFRIIDVDPAGQHPDGRPAAPHTAQMGVRIDPDRAAADDRRARLGQLIADVAGGAAVIRVRPPGADDRDGQPPPQAGNIPPDIKDRRRAIDMQQAFGIVLILYGHDPAARLFAPPDRQFRALQGNGLDGGQVSGL